MNIESLLQSQIRICNEDWASSDSQLVPRGFSPSFSSHRCEVSEKYLPSPLRQQDQKKQQQRQSRESRLMRIQENLTKLHAAAAKVEEAIGIMADYDPDPRPREDRENECGADDDDMMMPPPPALKRKRSDSPTGTAMTNAFFQEDFYDSFSNLNNSPCIPLLGDFEEESGINLSSKSNKNAYTSSGSSNINNTAIEPLPLLSSVSRDLSDLLHQYMPKPSLSFQESATDRELLKENTEESAISSPSASSSFSSPFKKRKLLPEFPLMIEDTGDPKESAIYDPFGFVQEKSSKALTSPAKPVRSKKSRNAQSKTKKVRKKGSTTADLLKKTTQRLSTTKSKKNTPAFGKKNLKRAKEVVKDRIKQDVKILTVHKVQKENQQLVQETWDYNYAQLLAFYNKHGHSNVLRSDANTKLSGWVKRQRNNLKDHKLSPDQIERLESLDFVWNRLESAWMQKFVLLSEFAETHGHCEVPTMRNRSLSEWCQRQKREYRRQAKTMTDHRISQLNTLPGWHWGYKCDAPLFKQMKNSVASRPSAKLKEVEKMTSSSCLSLSNSLKESEAELTSSTNEASKATIATVRQPSSKLSVLKNEDESEFLDETTPSTKSAQYRGKDYVPPNTNTSSFLVI